MMGYFWKFVHHKIAHGLLLGWPWKEPEWVWKFHDWTGKILEGYDLI